MRGNEGANFGPARSGFRNAGTHPGNRLGRHLAVLRRATAFFTAGLLRHFHDEVPSSPYVAPIVGSLLFAAIFVTEMGWSGIAPLIPGFQERYGLTEAQAGLVFTLASAGILVASLPAGALSRRFAVRPMTLWAMVSITAANLTLAVADLVGDVARGLGASGGFFGVRVRHH